MRALELPVEEDPPSRGVQAIAELDVLHGWAREGRRVEAADLPEVDAANGAQPGPEGGRRRAAFLMDEVVEQVAIARDQPRRSRGVVVGAEHRGERGIIREGPSDACEPARSHDHVGVDEHEHLALRVRRAVVPSGRGAAAPLESEHARAGAEGHGGRRLRGRTIDDDDELGGRRELRPQGVQARRELAPVIVRRNDDRAAHEGGRRRLHPSPYYGRRRARPWPFLAQARAVRYDDNCLMMSRFPDASTGIAPTGSTVIVMLGPRNSESPRARARRNSGVNWAVGTTSKVTAPGAVCTA